jgi:uncharacterized membrane protein YphA (DoxX/SURF4 family)
MESAALPRHRTTDAAQPRVASRADAGHQAFLLLRVVFAIAPIAFGLDKFFDVLVDWPQYLAPWIDNIVPGSAQQAMYGVGVVEIVAGLVVALKPRYGAPLVAAWLAGIIVNLLTYSGYYDIALRDFGLIVGALALTRLAWHYDPPRGQARTGHIV